MLISLHRRARSSGLISPWVFFCAEADFLCDGLVTALEGEPMFGRWETGVAVGVGVGVGVGVEVAVADPEGNVSRESEAGGEAGDAEDFEEAGFESFDCSHPTIARAVPAASIAANIIGRQRVKPLGDHTENMAPLAVSATRNVWWLIMVNLHGRRVIAMFAIRS